MLLSQFLLKINMALLTPAKVFIDSEYVVDCAYFEEDDLLVIETTKNGKCTLFNIETITEVKEDGTVIASGGDESFTVQFT